jgi:citrate lyase gamma subunit
VGGADALAGSLAATDVRVGANPAQSGAVRLANNQSITARNAANTTDQVLLSVDASNQTRVGQSGAVMTLDASYIQVASLLYFNAAGYVAMDERTAPSAPPANRVNLWCEDNGSGKSRLMCQFGTGAKVQIAIEP